MTTGRGVPWPEEALAWLLANPLAGYDAFRAAGFDRSFSGWRQKRAELGLPRRDGEAFRGARPKASAPGMPPIEWDKAEVDFHWTDVLEPMERLREIAKAASGGQDRATVTVETDRPLPVLFISDWHVGSWGISYRKVAEVTRRIQEHKLSVAVLGDMLQMAIKLRNVLEVSDNALPPRLQMRFMESWLADLAPHVLWATWDNHAVERQEAATGFSSYAEPFRDKTIYHSGIGHVDLGVGGEEYKIASSHRFRGNSYLNPTHGQMRYLRFEGIDREVAVAGDSHRPAMHAYYDGPLHRVAVNCGTLQTDSGFAKRYFSLNTHDDMPVLVFWPDRHLIVPYLSLDSWLAVQDPPRAAKVPQGAGVASQNGGGALRANGQAHR